MNRLFPLQHSNKLLNLPSASLCFFHCLNSPKDCISVRPVKSLEKCCGPPIRVPRRLKVARQGGPRGRIISGIPSSILFGILDRLQPRAFHLPARNQRQRFLPVDLRPDALARTRKKSLQPGLFVFRPLLPVNPSVAQRNFELPCMTAPAPATPSAPAEATVPCSRDDSSPATQPTPLWT